MMLKKIIRPISSLIITFVIFILLFRKIPFDQVLCSIKNADFRIILIVPLISIFNGFFISSLRWKLILNRMGYDISAKETLFIKAASDPIISVIPLKAGEVTRILYLKRIKGIPPEKTIFSIFLEYFLNVCFIFIFIFLGAIVWLLEIGGNFSHKYVFLSFCLSKPKKFLFENQWLINLKTRFKSYFANRNVFLNKEVLFCSLLFISLEILCIYLLSISINIAIPFYAMLIYLPIVILVSSIPLTFLGLGMREGILVVLFQKYATSQELLAWGILYSFAEHIVPVLLGLSLTSLFVKKIISGQKRTQKFKADKHEAPSQ